MPSHTDRDIRDAHRANPGMGYRKLMHLLRYQGLRVTEAEVRRVLGAVRSARYGKFRIAWMSDGSTIHYQGEELGWNELEVTRAAALLGKTTKAVWIEYLSPGGVKWKRW